MGMGADARLVIKAELSRRIDSLAKALPHMTSISLASAVDDIRRIATNHDMNALAELSRGLENAISESSGATMVLPFLEAMSDAVDCESIDPAVAASFLASVSLRLHG
jgi:predicted transcriptional regulator